MCSNNLRFSTYSRQRAKTQQWSTYTVPLGFPPASCKAHSPLTSWSPPVSPIKKNKGSESIEWQKGWGYRRHQASVIGSWSEGAIPPSSCALWERGDQPRCRSPWCRHQRARPEQMVLQGHVEQGSVEVCLENFDFESVVYISWGWW